MKHKNPPKRGSVLEKDQASMQERFGEFFDRGEDFTPERDDRLLNAVFRHDFYLSRAHSGRSQETGRPLDGIDRRFRRLVCMGESGPKPMEVGGRIVVYRPAGLRENRSGSPVNRSDLWALRLAFGNPRWADRGATEPAHLARVMARTEGEVAVLLGKMKRPRRGILEAISEDTDRRAVLAQVRRLLALTLDEVNRLLGGM